MATEEILHTEINEEESQQESQQQEEESQHQYKDGQLLTFIRVRFPSNARSFPFLVGNRHFPHGKKVVAMSDRGMAVGYVNSFPYTRPYNKSMHPLRSISKVATEADIEQDRLSYIKEKEARTTCRRLAEKHQLEMDVVSVEYTQFGKKAVFYFIAPGRVDFRELVKELVTELKIRIELRQISLRDRTASLGGIGPCGRQLCCSSFLAKYGNVNIKMAKNQNLTLNPQKLNGVCGQLKCCIAYEDDVYTEKRRRLPQLNQIIKTENGDIGRVERLHILIEQFEMITKNGARRRYGIDQFMEKEKLTAEAANFPTQFEHITNETSIVITSIVKKEKKEDDFLSFLKEEEEEKAPPVKEVASEAPRPPQHQNQQRQQKQRRPQQQQRGDRGRRASSPSSPLKPRSEVLTSHILGEEKKDTFTVRNHADLAHPEDRDNFLPQNNNKESGGQQQQGPRRNHRNNNNRRRPRNNKPKS